MKLLATTAVAAALLATGLTAAQAQSDSRRDRPPAGSDMNAQSSDQPAHRSSTRATRKQTQPSTASRTGDRRSAQEQRPSSSTNDREAATPHRDRDQTARQSREPSTGQTAASERDRRSSGNEARDRQQDRRSATRDRDRRDAARDRDRRESADRNDQQRREAAGPNRRETTGQASDTRQGSDRRNARNDSRSRDRLSLSRDERTRVSARFSSTIDRMNVRPISRSRLSVSIGATVPRSIHLYSVPADIVSIYPRFRGMRFVAVEDDIVIVSPDSHRIVAVQPRSEGSHYALHERTRERTRETTGAATRDERLELRPEQRQIVRTTVMAAPACHYEQRVDFFLFMPLPRTIQVCDFPQRVVEEVPELRSYRYVIHGDEVAVVDPERDRVVEVLR
jgi:hypothetical protein